MNVKSLTTSLYADSTLTSSRIARPPQRFIGRMPTGKREVELLLHTHTHKLCAQTKLNFIQFTSPFKRSRNAKLIKSYNHEKRISARRKKCIQKATIGKQQAALKTSDQKKEIRQGV
jgi:hypothetical protein